MCGIMGFVGKSKNPTRSYELATSLLRETQARGQDATGFYSVGSSGIIDHFKIDKEAEYFVKKSQAWKRRCPDSICLIGHARASTHGTELKNINNHPHVTDDNQLALVHNGVISSYAYIAKTNNLNLQGQCDSEVLLRLIEAKEDTVEGIKFAFEEIEMGFSNMACLVSDIRNTDHPVFYAFRNRNPILFIDLRKELGQYFFCSEINIWEAAVRRSGMNKKVQNAKTESVPQDKIWKIDSKTMKIEKITVEALGNLQLYNRYNKINSQITTVSPTINSSIFLENKDEEYESEIDDLCNLFDDIKEATERVMILTRDHDYKKEKETIEFDIIRKRLEPILNSLEELEQNIPTVLDIDKDDDDDGDTISGEMSASSIYHVTEEAGARVNSDDEFDLCHSGIPGIPDCNFQIT